MEPKRQIPISGLEHLVYCDRQFALIHVDGVWAENTHTVRGQRQHRRVDSGEISTRKNETIYRSMDVWSENHGLVGRTDAVHVEGSRITPVEYKAGVRHGRTADVQLCAQALCLEEMLGLAVPEGAIWYFKTRRRVPVVFNDELREYTSEVIDKAHSYLEAATLPEATADERCTECQLLGHCQPFLVTNPGRVASYMSTLQVDPKPR